MNLCFLDFRLISKLSLRKVKLTCKVGGSQVLRPTPTGVRRSQAGNLSLDLEVGGGSSRCVFLLFLNCSISVFI